MESVTYSRRNEGAKQMKIHSMSTTFFFDYVFSLFILLGTLKQCEVTLYPTSGVVPYYSVW